MMLDPTCIFDAIDVVQSAHCYRHADELIHRANQGVQLREAAFADDAEQD